MLHLPSLRQFREAGSSATRSRSATAAGIRIRHSSEDAESSGPADTIDAQRFRASIVPAADEGGDINALSLLW